jgi:hypothetical protein
MTVSNDIRRALQLPAAFDFNLLLRSCLERATAAIEDGQPVAARDWIEAARSAANTARELTPPEEEDLEGSS